MSTKPLYTAIAVAATGAFCAAASGAPTWKPFEDVDRNGDGQISQPEARFEPKLDFAQADLDRDGSISRLEYLEISCRCIGRG